MAGPNHVLPTARSARFSSGLGVLDFMKRSTFLGCDAGGLARLGPPAISLAEGGGTAGARPLGSDPLNLRPTESQESPLR